jgi:GntR family transcriptional regulator
MASYEPLHTQLKNFIINSIRSGDFQPGSKLPSQRELCLQHKISHMTVRRAINELVREGYIISVPARGLFVKEQIAYPLENFKGFNTLTREGGQKPSNVVLDAKIIPVTPSLAQGLLISESSQVFYLNRLRIIDSSPVMIQYSWLPYELCPGIQRHDFSAESLFEVLSNDYNIKVVEGYQTIKARIASNEECQLLNLSEPGVVLTVDAIEYSQTHLPVEFSISIFNPLIHPLKQTNRAE